MDYASFREITQLQVSQWIRVIFLLQKITHLSFLFFSVLLLTRWIKDLARLFGMYPGMS